MCDAVEKFADRSFEYVQQVHAPDDHGVFTCIYVFNLSEFVCIIAKVPYLFMATYGFGLSSLLLLSARHRRRRHQLTEDHTDTKFDVTQIQN